MLAGPLRRRGQLVVLAKIVGMSRMNQVRTVKRELP